MASVHVVDNPKITDDPFLKVRAHLVHAQSYKVMPFLEWLSLDESIIQYDGWHGCKQFISGKPIHLLQTMEPHLIQWFHVSHVGSLLAATVEEQAIYDKASSHWPINTMHWFQRCHQCDKRTSYMQSANAHWVLWTVHLEMTVKYILNLIVSFFKCIKVIFQYICKVPMHIITTTASRLQTAESESWPCVFWQNERRWYLFLH